MLIAPIDAVSASGWDPTEWDTRLKDLEAMKYVLFIGVNRPIEGSSDLGGAIRFCDRKPENGQHFREAHRPPILATA
jgi:hypothetical protein